MLVLVDCDGERDDPIPGFNGAMAGNVELSDPMLLSGVMVLAAPADGAARLLGGGDTGGLDQENAAAGDAFLEPARLVTGLEGSVVDEVAEAEAFAHGSPPNISEPAFNPWFPRTSASKPPSPSPLVESSPPVPGSPLKLMNSLRDVEGALFAPNSWSFLVCSFSTREESDLMSVMYAWNWFRFRRGPRLKFHRIGSTSIARKSLSIWLPIALKTSSAAICGYLVNARAL